MKAKTLRVVSATALLVAAGGLAQAADLPSRRAPPVFVPPPVFSWSGFYIGAFLGGGSGQSRFADPFGQSIYGDNVRTPFVEGGGQIGYNFQAPGSHYVFGLEADGGAVGLNATNTCLAYSGFFVPGNCRVRANAMATGTGRVGYAFGAEGHTLAYVKGGVAALFEHRDITVGGSLIGDVGGPFGSSADQTRVGYTVGAGLEQAFSNAWSIKVEYDYANFGRSRISTPQSLVVNPNGNFTSVGPTPTNVRQDLHELKVGLNYHLGADSAIQWNTPDIVAAAGAYNFNPNSYVVEAGGRYWYSFGRFQKDLGSAPGAPNNALISRLAYNDNSNSGEFFGRIDTPANVFVKGFVGAGRESRGNGNDEDFLLPFGNSIVGYSNTASGQAGSLNYATVDLGYSFFKTVDTNFGGFVGYNYYKDNKSMLGGAQIANQNSDLAGANASPPSVTGITENDRYNSVRLGLSADMWLGQFRVQADAAYLPYVNYKGTDTHLQRTDVANNMSPQFGNGQGVQLDLFGSYYFTPNFSVGVGGRYWSMWIPNAATNDFSQGPLLPLPVHTERYGVTAQASYRFSSYTPAPVVARY